MLLLAVVILPFGVPRFLNPDDHSPSGRSDDARFVQVCHEHGGRPQILRGKGAGGGSQRFCRVRYGRRVYVMDAITPNGFDADTAKFQRQGCAEARDRAEAGAGAGGPDETFIYHATTGVCEKRPLHERDRE